MKNRCILSLLLSISILFSFPMTASAIDSSLRTKSYSYNEYDYIEILRDSTPHELEELGVSIEEADDIISQFEDALSDRASLPDFQLRAYGYNDSEISLLHSYASGQILTAAELRAIGSTCTAEINCHFCATRAAAFSYTWTWNRCPLITLSDSSALRWLAYDANGGEVGVIQTSGSMTIEYHFQGNASSGGSYSFAHTGYGTNEPNLDFNTVNMQFPVYQTHSSVNGIISDCYAKTGTVYVSVRIPDGVNQTIHHIFVSGLYGHTLVGIGSPSISVSKGAIGISFTGQTSIDSIAARTATIYQSTGTVQYW